MPGAHIPAKRLDGLGMRPSAMMRRNRVPKRCLRQSLFLSLAACSICLLHFPLPSFAQEDVPVSLMLEDCIEISLASSPGVIAARERIEQARAAVGRARSGFYPRLSIRETFARSSHAPTVFSNQLAQGELSGDFPALPGADPFDQFNDPSPLTNWNTRLLLEWPIYRGGGTLHENRAATANLRASELALEAIHGDLAFSVSSAYYEILKSRNSISVAEQSIRRIRAHLDVAKARFENETALRSDVLRVEVRLGEAEEALEIAKHNLERAKSRLNLAMGRSVNESLGLADARQHAPSRLDGERSLEELMRIARRNRSEIEGMDRNIEALDGTVRAAKAQYYPQVDAFAHYDVDTEDFSDGEDSWTVGVGASISIFDGFLKRSAVRSARGKLREAESQKRQLILGIEMEVKDSFLARSETAVRIDVLEDSVSSAGEALRIVAERYAEGLVLVTDLLDAEVALTNTRLRLVSARYDHMIATAALERAIGAIIGEESQR